MQLLDVAGGLAGTYSGGMVRRLELAQALVNRPSLLILDEPTVGLDPIARDSVWAQVGRMQPEFGMTVLLTTHYMQEADALCDRVALMHRGQLQAVGSPAELKRMVRLRHMSPPARLRQRRSRTSSGTTRARISARTRSRLGCVQSGTAGRRRDVSVEHKVAVEIVRAPRGWRRMRGMAMRVGAFAVVELQKLRHDHTELFTRMVQPALWLLIFGKTFSQLRVIDTGPVPYWLSGAGHHRAIRTVHLDLLWHPDHLGPRRGYSPPS